MNAASPPAWSARSTPSRSANRHPCRAVRCPSPRQGQGPDPIARCERPRSRPNPPRAGCPRGCALARGPTRHAPRQKRFVSASRAARGASGACPPADRAQSGCPKARSARQSSPKARRPMSDARREDCPQRSNERPGITRPPDRTRGGRPTRPPHPRPARRQKPCALHPPDRSPAPPNFRNPA